MRGAISLLPQYVFMAWGLVKHRDNFTFFKLCHHGMTYPQVEDGREGLLKRWLAVNILNRESRTADKSWSWSQGTYCRLRCSSSMNILCYDIFTKASELEGLFGTSSKTVIIPSTSQSAKDQGVKCVLLQ
jgi:hypothetical protein